MSPTGPLEARWVSGQRESQPTNRRARSRNRTRVCYPKHPPYLELMQELPGTCWICNEAPLGYANHFDPLGVRIEYDRCCSAPPIGGVYRGWASLTAVPRVEEAHFNIIVA